MAARRTKTDGLTGEDVQRLRDQLADGRRPRVQVSGPQFDGATTATVIRVGDPSIDGSDYLTVRVKVNGVQDELAFAPAELSLRRAQPDTRRTPAPRKAPARRTPASGAPASRAPAGRAPAGKAPTSKAPAAQTPTLPAPDRPATAAAATPRLPGDAVDSGAATRPDQPPGGKSPASSPARRRKPAIAPKVSFTVTSSGASWSVGATRGAKGIIKNVAVPPGVVTALAELLGQPALLDAVAEINETALSEARARADQLRAELDQLEAVLATHRAPGNQARR